MPAKKLLTKLTEHTSEPNNATKPLDHKPASRALLKPINSNQSPAQEPPPSKSTTTATPAVVVSTKNRIAYANTKKKSPNMSQSMDDVASVSIKKEKEKVKIDFVSTVNHSFTKNLTTEEAVN